jgi:RNA polymerase sigma-54 factor
MKLSLGLSQKMALEQRLSPQMVMQMTLLGLPLLDFNAEIEAEASDNPALEVTKPSDIPLADAGTGKEDTRNDEWDEKVLQRIAELGEYPNLASGSWAGGTSTADEEWSDPILRVSPTRTLTEDLQEQIRLNFSGKEEVIGDFIVQDLDSRGFLLRSHTELVADISAYAEMELNAAEVEVVIQKLKDTLEPPGLCAESIEDSIAIQLRRAHKSKFVDLVVKGYNLLRAGKERDLIRLCTKNGIEPSFVFEELEKIHFVPTFGVADEAFDSNNVRPEVMISNEYPERHGAEKYEIKYNNSASVQLSLNSKVIEMARRRKTLSKEEHRFLKEKVDKAQWLKRVADERRSLLLDTVQIIVNRQWEFLDKGRRYLRPLTQREIADEVGRDESTISRMISGRFATTPQGTLALSAFFSQAVGRSSGTAAREVLKEMMETERDGNAYTDDELAEMMRRRGFAIQRRTVNKYRRMLGSYFALKRSVRRAMNRASRVS